MRGARGKKKRTPKKELSYFDPETYVAETIGFKGCNVGEIANRIVVATLFYCAFKQNDNAAISRAIQAAMDYCSQDFVVFLENLRVTPNWCVLKKHLA